jgi:Na+-transporting methylmalonyl-CoA/oxaloacetate decarboxylase gamma subunit
MDIDWGRALEIGGLGFGLVFGVLTLLAFSMWFSGKILKRLGMDNNQEEEEK